VAGIEKLIIWAVKMNAPITPINGARLSSRDCLTRRAQCASNPTLAAHTVPPTAGEINASAMCIT
jgi:hypothetical protein